jgi:2-succinyl-6-hydroxy-2,4-cyclohexadiene-1-carboxylate synthase
MLTADIGGVPHAYRLSAPTAIAQTPLGSSLAKPGSSAETLVFIHGWLLSQAYWQPLVNGLSDRYCCLTYDLRGFGDSVQVSTQVSAASKNSKPRYIQLPLGRKWYPHEDSEHAEQADHGLDHGSNYGPDHGPKHGPDYYAASPYSLAAYAQDLKELLDYLGLEKVWLVGHSLGGSVALWAAYLLPERVKGVICLNAGGGIYIPKEFEKFRTAGQQMVKFRPMWLAKVPLLPRVFTRAMVYRRLDIRWGQQRIRDFVRADRAAAEGALLESTTCEEVHQLPQLVAQLAQPVHFITASQDTIMPPRYVRYLASFHARFEQSKTVLEIAQCGHMAMVEQPQAVVDAITQILTSSY